MKALQSMKMAHNVRAISSRGNIKPFSADVDFKSIISIYWLYISYFRISKRESITVDKNPAIAWALISCVMKWLCSSYMPIISIGLFCAHYLYENAGLCRRLGNLSSRSELWQPHACEIMALAKASLNSMSVFICGPIAGNVVISRCDVCGRRE